MTSEYNVDREEANLHDDIRSFLIEYGRPPESRFLAIRNKIIGIDEQGGGDYAVGVGVHPGIHFPEILYAYAAQEERMEYAEKHEIPIEDVKPLDYLTTLAIHKEDAAMLVEAVRSIWPELLD